MGFMRMPERITRISNFLYVRRGFKIGLMIIFTINVCDFRIKDITAALIRHKLKGHHCEEKIPFYKWRAN